MVDKTILDILSEKGIELKREGSVIRAFCPFHNDTGRPNFTVYPDTNSWFCFACNMGGDVISFTAKFENISYSAAKSKLTNVLVNLEGLQESWDGLRIPEESVPLNDELNVLVSRMCRNYLRDNPDKVDSLLDHLKSFDTKLLQPVTLKRMGELLTEIKANLK